MIYCFTAMRCDALHCEALHCSAGQGAAIQGLKSFQHHAPFNEGAF